jgi:integrase
MRGNAHVRFGGRAEETDVPKSTHRASARPDHTHATLALQANVHPKVVAERLGHASVMITLDTYSHAIPSLQEEAAAKVADLVFGA